ncbi:hypothetical protein D9C73_005209 [Collichthys lucidus]|uniref:Uncharacterized protein n=1 Tax=Collichthys lucidus TaxID=240159 RepID=A0A4U5UBL8_COLLU|nr:hypothetical protein D9C73_005209 [Collichthys lucidus]
MHIVKSSAKTIPKRFGKVASGGQPHHAGDGHHGSTGVMRERRAAGDPYWSYSVYHFPSNPYFCHRRNRDPQSTHPPAVLLPCPFSQRDDGSLAGVYRRPAPFSDGQLLYARLVTQLVQ